VRPLLAKAERKKFKSIGGGEGAWRAWVVQRGRGKKEKKSLDNRKRKHQTVTLYGERKKWVLKGRERHHPPTGKEKEEQTQEAIRLLSREKERLEPAGRSASGGYRGSEERREMILSRRSPETHTPKD